MTNPQEDFGYLVIKVRGLSDMTDIDDVQVQINHPDVIKVEIIDRADATSRPWR